MRGGRAAAAAWSPLDAAVVAAGGGVADVDVVNVGPLQQPIENLFQIRLGGGDVFLGAQPPAAAVGGESQGVRAQVRGEATLLRVALALAS